MIIAVSGVDGSGKSTPIELLERSLRMSGYRPSVLWFRPGYSDLMVRLKAAVRGRKPDLVPTTDDPVARQRAFAKRHVRMAWMAMAVTDMLLNLAGRVRLLGAAGRVVICDRYLFDSLLDLELRFEEFQTLRPAIERALRVAVPSPDLSLLLLVPRHVMHERLAKKQEPFPDPPELRDARFDRYLDWAKSGRVTVIDGDQSIQAVHREIVDLVGQALGRPLNAVEPSA